MPMMHVYVARAHVRGDAANRSIISAMPGRPVPQVMVQCGGTLATACCPEWRRCRRPRIIGHPFLLGGGWEGIGNTLSRRAAAKPTFIVTPTAPLAEAICGAGFVDDLASAS